MEGSIVTVAENCERGDSVTPVPQLLGSFVKIDSISIDLGIPMEKDEPGKCHSFSIRGYVAQMRQKDIRKCAPFPTDGHDASKLEEQLPPLHCPKFRWWCCKTCLHHNGTETTSEAAVECNGSIPRSTCPDMPAHSDATIAPSDLQQPPEVENFERRADAHTSANLIADNNFKGRTDANACEEKTTDVEDAAISGNEDVSGNGSNQDANPTYLTNFESCLNQDRLAEGTVAIRSNSSGSAAFCEPSRIVHNTADTGSLGGICPAEDFSWLNVSRAGELSDVGRKTGEDVNASEVPHLRIPSCDLEQHDNSSSESDGSELKKAPKLRLLTDLSDQKVRRKNDHRTEGGSSKTVSKACLGIASVSATQAEVGFPESGGSEFKRVQKKRKVPHIQNQKSLELGCPTNVGKKVGTSRRETDSAVMTIEISDSESEGETHANLGLQTVFKNWWKVHGADTVAAQKNKQIQYGDGFPPLGPRPVLLPHKNHAEVGEAARISGAVDATSSRSEHDLFRTRGPEACLESSMSLQPTTEKGSSSKKKSRSLQFDNGQTSLFPFGKSLWGEGSNGRRDLEVLQTGSQTVTPHSGSINYASDLSLNNFKAGPRNEKTSTASAAETYPSWAPQKGTPAREVRRKLGPSVAESSIPHEPAPASSSMGGDLLGSLMETAWRTAIQYKHRHTYSRPEDGSSSSRQNLDSTQPANQMGEGTSDDGSIEVAAVLARLNEIPDEKQTAIMKSLPQSSGALRSSRRRVQPTLMRPPGGGNVAPARGNPVGFSHSDRSHFTPHVREEYPTFLKFGAISQSQLNQQQRVPIGIPFSASNMQLNCAGNSLCTSSSRQNEKAGHVWPFLTPVHPAPGTRIQQRSKSQTSNTGENPESLESRKGKIAGLDLSLNLNNGNPERLNKGHATAEPLRRTTAECQGSSNQAGSLDPYSNDSIGAMQLLSLMDSRNPLNTIVERPLSQSFSMGGKSTFVGKTLHPGARPPEAFNRGERSQQTSSSYHGMGLYPPGQSTRQIVQRLFFGPSDSLTFPIQGRTVKDPSIDLVASRMQRTTRQPVGNISESYVCTVNRNPADISIVGEGNPYMINGEDLFRKKVDRKGKAVATSTEGRKRQKS